MQNLHRSTRFTLNKCDFTLKLWKFLHTQFISNKKILEILISMHLRCFIVSKNGRNFRTFSVYKFLAQKSDCVNFFYKSHVYKQNKVEFELDYVIGSKSSSLKAQCLGSVVPLAMCEMISLFFPPFLDNHPLLMTSNVTCRMPRWP